MHPKDVDFDTGNERIVCITEDGLFTIWDFNTLKVRVAKHFDLTTTKMVVIKKALLVAVCFEKKFMMLDIHDDSNVHEIDSFTKKFSLVTSEMKLNLEEDILAVAMAPDYDTCTNIEIYKINYESKVLELYHRIPSLPSSIEFMDFSSNGVYLMYEDNIKTRCFFDINNKVKNEDEKLKHEVEWIGDGLRISEKIGGLDRCYNEDNYITCLLRAGKNSLVACDQIGTVSLDLMFRFEYLNTPATLRGTTRFIAHI